jgi:hypothetical protein
MATSFPGFVVSLPREMRLGGSYQSTSGILHELDLVCSRGDLRIVWELKHWSNHAEKNAVVGFWAKLIDFLAANSDLAAQENVPVFMTTSTFDAHGLAAALGLGIEPLAPGLRPLPVLAYNLRLLDAELKRTPAFRADVEGLVDDYGASCARLATLLVGSSMSERVGRISDTAISLKTRSFDDAVEAASLLRLANGQWTNIQAAWARAKAAKQ